MAIAEKALAENLTNRALILLIITHGYFWVWLPDGRDLPRGLWSCRNAEAGNLIAIWDDNGISIDGHVEAGLLKIRLPVFVPTAGMSLKR